MKPHPLAALVLSAFPLAGQEVASRRIEYGRSLHGEPLVAFEIARTDGPLPPEKRPGLLVVGGLVGHREASVAVVEHHLRALVEASDAKTKQLLRDCTVWLVPRANPDGLAAFAKKRDREVTGNLSPVDDDRDGRTDEDPGDDLDGDGVVTRMRVRDPEGEWIVDASDPRILRRANLEKGERGVYKLLVEGKDDDGDGVWNEDEVGDVDLDRNFAHGFAEHDPRTGLFAMSQPETRALADFVLAHPSIALALVYGADDTLLAEPRVEAKNERTPPTGILAGDLPIYRELGESYRKATGRKGKAADRHDGSLWSWLYCDLGVPAFACSFWTLPSDTPAKARTPDSAPQSSPTVTDDDATKLERARLLWCDQNGESARFAPWTKVSVPGLEDVAVGGWRPAALVEPPRAELPALLASHQAFVIEMLGWFAQARIVATKVEAKGGGVWELSASVGNEGRLPLRTATGARSTRVKQTRLTLEPGSAKVLMGKTHERVDDLALGKRHTFTWLVQAPAGTKVKLHLQSALAGAADQEVEIR